LKPHEPDRRPRWWERPIGGFFRVFNYGFDAVGRGYAFVTARTVRVSAIVLLVYAAILAFGLNEFRKAPTGFIPALGRGYLIVVVQLPPGASLSRTDAVQQRLVDLALATPGVGHAVNIVGFSGATFTNAPNAGAIFLTLDPWEQRARDPRQSSGGITAELFKKFASIEDALVLVVQPPPVAGIGNAGGFRMMVEDRAGRGAQALQQAAATLAARAAQTQGIFPQVFTLFETSTPQLYLDIDRTKAQLLGINVADVFNALQVLVGSSYVN